MYFIVDKVNGFTEEKKGNKYVRFTFTDNNKNVLKKYAELWNGIKNLIEIIDNKPGKYGRNYMKKKFISDDNLPLDKPLKFHNLTIIVRSILKKMVNAIHKFFETNICMSYKNVAI